jgi:hypothetical protein
MPRSVAFLDILGFKQLLDNKPLEELAARYENAVLATNAMNSRFSVEPGRLTYLPNHAPGEPWCHRTIFSDSIILTSLDESAESCLKLLLYARMLLIHLFAMGFSIRGSVAAGALYHNPATSVTLGHALTEAYLLEQQQEWAGICISDSVWSHYPSLKQLVDDPYNALHYYFLQYTPPWKGTAQPASHVLNWRFNCVFSEGTKGLLERSGLNEHQEKFSNTLELARYVRTSGAVHFHDGSPKPSECPTVYIGPNEPPFPHGDDL